MKTIFYRVDRYYDNMGNFQGLATNLNHAKSLLGVGSDYVSTPVFTQPNCKEFGQITKFKIKPDPDTANQCEDINSLWEESEILKDYYFRRKEPK